MYMEHCRLTEMSRDLGCLFYIVFKTLSLVMICFLKAEEFSTVYEFAFPSVKDTLISLKVQTR